MVYNPKYIPLVKKAKEKEKETKAQEGLVRVAPYAWIKKEHKEQFYKDFKEFKKTFE